MCELSASHCEERERGSNHFSRYSRKWIASLALAKTSFNSLRLAGNHCEPYSAASFVRTTPTRSGLARVSGDAAREP